MLTQVKTLGHERYSDNGADEAPVTVVTHRHLTEVATHRFSSDMVASRVMGHILDVEVMGLSPNLFLVQDHGCGVKSTQKESTRCSPRFWG